MANLTIHDFERMMNATGAGTFKTQAENTKGVLYMNASGNLCNANRHSRSLTIRDTSAAQAARNVELKLALVSVLGDAGASGQLQAKARRMLGLDDATGELSNAPLKRRDVKILLTAARNYQKAYKADLDPDMIIPGAASPKAEVEKVRTLAKRFGNCSTAASKLLYLQGEYLSEGAKSALKKYVTACDKVSKDAIKYLKYPQADANYARSKMVKYCQDFIQVTLNANERKAFKALCKFARLADKYFDKETTYRGKPLDLCRIVSLRKDRDEFMPAFGLGDDGTTTWLVKGDDDDAWEEKEEPGELKIPEYELNNAREYPHEWGYAGTTGDDIREAFRYDTAKFYRAHKSFLSLVNNIQ